MAKPKLLPAGNIQTDIFNYRSKEFFINLKPSDIPPKDHPDYEAFVSYEEDKCLMGVNINGVEIAPTLYWDLNHWAIMKDIKDSRGIIRKVPMRPDLRDNDWIIHNAVWDAERNPGGVVNLIEGTARQLGKSKNKASILGRDLMLIDNCNDLLLCGNSGDLIVMMEYLLEGTENCTEFFRVDRLTKDKKSQLFKWGFKDPQNNEIVKSALHVRNAQGGKVTEVSAGVTIYRAILDEVAKYLFLSSYETIKPALISEFGIRSSSILSFTGGDVERSKDAETIFLNPAANRFKEFENEGKKTGLFLGGWYRQDLKNWSTLGKYLDIQDTTHELYDLPMRVTDFDHANRVLDAEMDTAAKSPDPTSLIKQKMYNPRSIADMFLRPDANPFNVEALLRHREYLLQNPIGFPAELYRDNLGKVKFRHSDKRPIMEYPIRNHLVSKDAPLMIYDLPKHEEHYDLHVLGCDPYNQDETSISKSLGAFYVMRRIGPDLSDNFTECIVASYAGRPALIKQFFQLLEMVQEFYNGSILFEHSGSPLLQYFDERHKTTFLMDTYNLQKEINPRSAASNSKGLKPTVANKSHLLNLVIDYLDEELGDGRPGLTRIPDPMLIEELIAYDGEKNVDRYDGFAHAVANMYAKRKFNMRPILNREVREAAYEPHAPRTAFQNLYSKTIVSDSRKGPRNAFNV